jgi:type I restriction enzyme S subunit
LTENAAKIVLHNREKVDPVYLTHALRSQALQRQMHASTGQVTIGKLALFKIEELEVSLPAISEQRRFASEVSAVKKVRKSITRSFDSADALFSSLQHRAFSGQL